MFRSEIAAQATAQLTETTTTAILDEPPATAGDCLGTTFAERISRNLNVVEHHARMINHLEWGKAAQRRERGTNTQRSPNNVEEEEEEEGGREKKLFRGSFTRFQVHRSLSVKVHDRCELYTHIYTLTHSLKCLVSDDAMLVVVSFVVVVTIQVTIHYARGPRPKQTIENEEHKGNDEDDEVKGKENTLTIDHRIETLIMLKFRLF